MKKLNNISLRCYFPGEGNSVTHYQTMPLKDIPKWIEAYHFTHPTCEAITIKVWLHDERSTGNENDQ